MEKPILGISMGDPFGNGPEITVKALADKSVYDRCRPLVVGDIASMEYAAKVAEKVSGIHLPFIMSLVIKLLQAWDSPSLSVLSWVKAGAMHSTFGMVRSW